MRLETDDVMISIFRLPEPSQVRTLTSVILAESKQTPVSHAISAIHERSLACTYFYAVPSLQQ